MTSAIRQLLDEISWEGNATKYRDGGRGLENVLTTEVFQALDFLPRAEFLGQVLRHAHGAEAAREVAVTSIEAASVDVLPGDLVHAELGFRAQPDVLVQSDTAYVLVEAKRIRRSSFGPEQLAREVLAVRQEAAGRSPLVLVVTGAEPPIAVRDHGRMALLDAVSLGASLMSERLGRVIEIPGAEAEVAFITWSEVAEVVDTALPSASAAAGPSASTLERLVRTVIEAVSEHS